LRIFTPILKFSYDSLDTPACIAKKLSVSIPSRLTSYI
jgi:hypothetical protein